MAEYNIRHRSAKINERYKREPGNNNVTLNKIYIGKVRDTNDPQNMGRILLWIPELSGNKDEIENWHVASYCSPFAGASFVDNQFYKDLQSNAINKLRQSNQDRTPKDGRQSYGMWFTPPDIGNEVICTFISGDGINCIWFGCLIPQNQNYMLPGIASGQVQSAGASKDAGPVIETDLTTRDNLRNPKRKEFSPLYNGLIKQGLNTDSHRGQSTSSAQRESPSRVFGILSPAGHQFVMDDGAAPDNNFNDNDPKSFIRLRTKSGSQLLIDENSGFIYAITKDGRSWIELGNDGNIDVYGRSNISVHAEQGNINLKASGPNSDINIQSGRDINLRADRRINFISADNFNLITEGDFSQTIGGKLSLDANDDIAIKAGGDIGITASGDYREQASKIYMNSGQGPQPDTAEEPLTFKNVPGATQGSDPDGPWTAGEPFPGTNIVPRVPQHEPWVSRSNTEASGTNNQVVRSESGAKLGSTRSDATKPNTAIKPDGSVLSGTGYDNNGNPQYIVSAVSSSNVNSVSSFRVTETGKDLVRTFEQPAPTPVANAAGITTVGYGHVVTPEEIASGRFDTPLTEAEMNTLLDEDLEAAERTVQKNVTQPVSQGQYDALVSFAANVGPTAFKNSDVLKDVNDGKTENVATCLSNWNTTRENGNVIKNQGLTNRREAEAQRFTQIT